MPSADVSRRRRNALLVIALALLAAGMTFIGASPSAEAARNGHYSPPDWFPLRGSHQMNCNKGNPGCPGYHGKWALDLVATTKDLVYAAGAGYVETVVRNQGNPCVLPPPYTATCPEGAKGNNVLVTHSKDGKLQSFYQHLSSVLPEIVKGAWVDEHTPLGYAGSSGPVSRASFVHLHFERRVGGVAVHPRLKACHGSTTVWYPDALGRGSQWNQVPTEQYKPRSDSSVCAYAGQIVQWEDDRNPQKAAWYVGGDLKRYWIPDIPTFHCLTGNGIAGPTMLPARALDQLPDQRGQWATCKTQRNDALPVPTTTPLATTLTTIAPLTPLPTVTTVPITTPATNPPPTTPPPPVLYTDQCVSRSGCPTFQNITNAGGQGPRIPSGGHVQITCKAKPPSTIPSAKPDGYWYLIASSPWNNQYWGVANSFHNGGDGRSATNWSIRDC